MYIKNNLLILFLVICFISVIYNLFQSYKINSIEKAISNLTENSFIEKNNNEQNLIQPQNIISNTNLSSLYLDAKSLYLDNYSGDNYTTKFKNLICDVTNNYKNEVMEIVLPSGVIEITEDLVIDGWTNKTIKSSGVLYFNNCNAIEFKNIQQCDITIHRISSVIPAGNTNPQGFISINSTDKLQFNGIKFTDCSYNRISINQILGFVEGLSLYSEYGSKGTFYNDFFIGTIWRCKTAITLKSGKAANDTSSISGWVNDNRFFNTMIDCNKGIVIGQPLSQRPTNEPADSYHNNKFYNIGFEQIRDKSDPIAIDMIQGVSNAFENPRFEKSMSDSGYMLIREGKDATLNLYSTSNYMLNLNRIKLNTSPTKETNSSNGKHLSTVIASLMKEGTAVLASKMIAIKGKVVYEAYGVDNYTLINYCPNNLINYPFNDSEFVKYKDSTGKIRIIKYTN